MNSSNSVKIFYKYDRENPDKSKIEIYTINKYSVTFLIQLACNYVFLNGKGIVKLKK